ncbi:MAG: glycoside hydrolase family 88 protein [Saprospiraceae bacterium]|nr:glycoside hydrolase family 88 protein [Saprospiraceae bacterium]
MMNKISLIVALTLLMTSSEAQISMAENFASTIMKQYQDSIVVKRYINQYSADGKPVQVNQSQIDKEEKRPAKWNYEIGVVLTGFERLWEVTGKREYLIYMKGILDHFVSDKGDIRTYDLMEFNLDNIPPGRQLLTLHKVYRDKRYLIAAGQLAKQLEWQPRLKEGGYWHKMVYPYQMWLDGLYMGEPFKAAYLKFNEDDAHWDDVADQFIWMAKNAIDEKTGLMYHGYDESRLQKWADPKTGKSPEFWSRAMGWYMMGIVDVLEMFPSNHAKRRELVAIYKNLAAAILRFQDPKTGTWWQVTDKGGREGNYLESSGTAMFVASILKGIRLGYLPESMLTPAQKAYEGMLNEFVTKDESGTFHFIRAVAGAGLGGNPYRDGSYQYYVQELTRNDDLKAIGPLMQACIEYELISEAKPGEGKVVLLDRYFNNEYKDGKRFHYTWDDPFDSGFSWFGNIFRRLGAKTQHLDTAPKPTDLDKANVYIIVDPDHVKDNPKPNYIGQEDITVITEWVRKGGNLLLMTNDTTNSDALHVNELAKQFGITFTMKNINFVKNDNYPDGAVFTTAGNGIFKENQKLFVKELVTLKTKKGVKKIAVAGKDIVMASANFGMGKVFVIGDPWIYNEYLNGRKLPSDYENFDAATALAHWLLK